MIPKVSINLGPVNSIKQLAGQTVIYGMGTMVPRVLNYALLTPFYTRIFGEDGYGVVTELYGVMAILMVLLTYGMETAYFRFSTNSHYDKDTVFSSSLMSLLATSSVFLVLVLAFTNPIADIMQYPGNPEYITMFSLIVAIDAFSALPFARLRIENKAMRFAFIKIVNVIVIVGVAVGFLYVIPSNIEKFENTIIGSLYNEDIGVGYAFIANLCGSIVSLLLLLPDIIKTRFSFSRGTLKAMLAYASPLLIAGLAGILIDNFDKTSMKYLLEDKSSALAQVGIYGANYKIAVLMAIFIQMFRYAAEPFFFSKAGDKNARSTYAGIMHYFLYFCLLIFLFIVFNIDLIKYLVPVEYWEALHIIPVLLWAFVFYGVFVNLSVWYKLNDLTKYAAILTVTGAVISISINVIYVPRYGYNAAAWSHLAAYSVMTILSYLIGKRIYKVPYKPAKILFYTLTTLLLFFAFKAWAPGNIVARITVGNLIILLYAFFIYVKEVKNTIHEFE